MQSESQDVIQRKLPQCKHIHSTGNPRLSSKRQTAPRLEEWATDDQGSAGEALASQMVGALHPLSINRRVNLLPLMCI